MLTGIVQPINYQETEKDKVKENEGKHKEGYSKVSLFLSIK
jgi:hypothetical protein